MKIALLGAGHETVPLVAALTTNNQHEVIAFWAADDFASEILTQASSARRLESAADVLNLNGLDAVAINASDVETQETVRQLAGNGVALLLVPHAAHGIEFIYQLGLIRDEQPDQFRLYPLRPWRLHPLVWRLKELLQTDRLGHIHQLQLEREEHVAGDPTQPALLSKQQADEALLADADLLKFVSGEFDQVTALQAGDVEKGLIQASVTMTGPQARPAQLVCKGTHQPTSWKLTVTGAAGYARLLGKDNWQSLTWESTIQGQTELEQLDFDFGPATVAEFESGLTAHQTGQWADDLNRIFDLLEGTQRSLRRRRTVELYFDTPSERSNFKTQMTAVGCSVLMLTLLTILMGLGMGIVANELKFPPIVMQIVRVLVFAPLFIFLALQAAIFLSKPSAGTRSGNT